MNKQAPSYVTQPILKGLIIIAPHNRHLNGIAWCHTQFGNLTHYDLRPLDFPAPMHHAQSTAGV